MIIRLFRDGCLWREIGHGKRDAYLLYGRWASFGRWDVEIRW